MTYEPIITPKAMQERAEHLAAMASNCFMRNSGILDEAMLEDYLTKAAVIGESHANQFGGFQIVFGFDTSGQDFVVVKDTCNQGAHLIFVADQ